MSFSHEVKKELASISEMPTCCTHAMAYGMLLFGRYFSTMDISLLSNYEVVAQKYIDLSYEVTKIKPKLTATKTNKYIASIDNLSNRKAVLTKFSCTGKESVARINRGNLANESISDEGDLNCCNAAFLRGAFLSCGTISNPDKSYHLEFVVPFKKLGEDLLRMLCEYDLKAKHIIRRQVNVIYIKDSSSIEDLLTIMGAQISALELMSVKVYKDLRNVTNRKSNFETANLSKTISAAYDQVMAIANIKEQGEFGSLSDELQVLAFLREENTEISLRELGEMMNPPLSRSAVNNRLNKLIKFSNELNERKTNTQTED